MKYNADLEPVYKCQHCISLLNQSDIDITKTDDIHVKHCPICGCEVLTLLKLED